MATTNLHVTPCVIFDIDGTLADAHHRLHHIKDTPKDWEAFYLASVDDAPIEAMVLLHNLFLYGEIPVIYCTGRSDRHREITENWLRQHLPVDEPVVYMRKEGDFRQDYEVKKEMLAQIQRDGYMPIMAVEDRNQVVRMFRDAGIVCLQCVDGDY